MHPLATLLTLDLNSTQVADLASLAGLANLQTLNLTNLPPGIESALPRRAEIKITRQ